VIAERVYSAIAAVYPVCCASDEFYFFPQVVQQKKEWQAWDDFSQPRVETFCDLLGGFEKELSVFSGPDSPDDDRVDAELLQQVLKTLREQLVDVATHRKQPTFHLTVLAAGLAEALASNDPEVWRARVCGVPVFLQRAATCLDAVPILFRDLGCEMLLDMKGWARSLQTSGYDIGEMLTWLEFFSARLQSVSTVQDYRLDEELMEQLVREHVGCGMDIDSLMSVLQEELQEVGDVLADQAAALIPGKDWREAEEQIPFVEAQAGVLLAIYRRELDRMESHCRHEGLVPVDVASAALSVENVPSVVAAIRASDAYAAIPGHPPCGGIFYVMETGRTRNGQPGRTLEYRMTAVHEAWPGHHLLDSCRWALKRPVRRPIESPLFYEGWACLAEELMARTGYLNGPWDRFLLARRRAERAARGMIDAGLQSGRMAIAEAIDLLVSVGYCRKMAEAVVPKYLLRPGYQVCYTLGLKQGLDLLNRFGARDIGGFARTVLSQGEIGFSRLEELFLNERQRSRT
jgi:hypothetical protein